MTDPTFNHEALKSEIRSAIINQKVNACPMAIRLAWHAAGTYDKNDKSGGSNGATMRFEPESTDPANAGLHILRNMLQPIKEAHPEITTADLWALSGCAAVEFLGGPKVNIPVGRVDHSSGHYCPPNGRLPNASLGAAHLRDVFYRMGFGDREIVALSGAHTLGRCHITRSGYDGPWTKNPLKFDNTYFKNLLYLEWRKRKWDGPEQFEDVESGELMMLPTDMALVFDPQFKVYVEMYAKDEQLFFSDFAHAFAKLLNNGVEARKLVQTPLDKYSADFREASMHGSLPTVVSLSSKADVHATERHSHRSALHKAAFWGHDAVVSYLLKDLRLAVNAQDFNGDTPLHDAVKYNQVKVVEVLLQGGADLTIKNKQGKDALALAEQYGHQQVISVLRQRKTKSRL